MYTLTYRLHLFELAKVVDTYRLHVALGWGLVKKSVYFYLLSYHVLSEHISVATLTTGSSDV